MAPSPTVRRARRPAPFRPRVEALEARDAPAVFTVVNTNDAGPGSFRQAILGANAHTNVGGVPDVINFNIPGGFGLVQTIQPATTLPAVIDPVTITGYSQPGTSPNT